MQKESNEKLLRSLQSQLHTGEQVLGLGIVPYWDRPFFILFVISVVVWLVFPLTPMCNASVRDIWPLAGAIPVVLLCVLYLIYQMTTPSTYGVTDGKLYSFRRLFTSIQCNLVTEKTNQTDIAVLDFVKSKLKPAEEVQWISKQFPNIEELLPLGKQLLGDPNLRSAVEPMIARSMLIRPTSRIFVITNKRALPLSTIPGITSPKFEIDKSRSVEFHPS